MKTHDLARALTQLAKLLRTAPNASLADLDLTPTNNLSEDGTINLAVSLHAFVELSRIPKIDWLTFVEEHDFPLEFRRRDASRDILFKVAAYLERDPKARKRLRDCLASTTFLH